MNSPDTRSSLVNSPSFTRNSRTMEERTTQLLSKIRKNRTDSKKSPHPKKLLGNKYSGVMRGIMEDDQREEEQSFEYMNEFETNIKKKASEVRKLEITNERLANLFRKTVKEQIEKSAQKYKEERQKTPDLVAELQKRVITYGDLVETIKHLEEEMYTMRDEVVEDHSHLCEQGVELFKLKQKSKQNYSEDKLQKAKLQHNPRLDLLTLKTVLGVKSIQIQQNEKVTYIFKNHEEVTVGKKITPYERQQLWDKAIQPSRDGYKKRFNPDACSFSVGHIKGKVK